MIKNHRVEELQDYFKTHNKSKEQKAHTSKVGRILRIIETKTSNVTIYVHPVTEFFAL